MGPEALRVGLGLGLGGPLRRLAFLGMPKTNHLRQASTSQRWPRVPIEGNVLRARANSSYGGPLRPRILLFQGFRRAVAISLAVALGSVVACSSSNDACLGMGKAICQKACACNGGTTCRFVQAGAGGTATKSEESCNQYFSDTCGTPSLAGVDFAKCAAEANGAQCLTNENAIDGPAKAAQLPPSCATRATAVKPDGG